MEITLTLIKYQAGLSSPVFSVVKPQQLFFTNKIRLMLDNISEPIKKYTMHLKITNISLKTFKNNITNINYTILINNNITLTLTKHYKNNKFIHHALTEHSSIKLTNTLYNQIINLT